MMIKEKELSIKETNNKKDVTNNIKAEKVEEDKKYKELLDKYKLSEKERINEKNKYEFIIKENALLKKNTRIRINIKRKKYRKRELTKRLYQN